MSANKHRVVFEVNDECLRLLHERIGSDDVTTVNQYVKEAVYQLVGAAPELSRSARLKLDRKAKRKAELERELAEMQESAKFHEDNPLIRRAMSGDTNPPRNDGDGGYLSPM